LKHQNDVLGGESPRSFSDFPIGANVPYRKIHLSGIEKGCRSIFPMSQIFMDDDIGDWRCSMAYADGLVFVGKPDFDDFGGTVALDAATGEVVWSHPGGGSSPAVADRMVFTVGKGRVYAFGGAGEEEDLQ